MWGSNVCVLADGSTLYCLAADKNDDENDLVIKVPLDGQIEVVYASAGTPRPALVTSFQGLVTNP